MSDDVKSTPTDPLRSGAIHKLARGTRSAPNAKTVQFVPKEGSLTDSANHILGSSYSSTSAGSASGPFDGAYSARVKARFSEVYRATPIPTSILYDSPHPSIPGVDKSNSGMSKGSADSGAGAGKDINDIPLQIPVKNISAAQSYMSPTVGISSRRYYKPQSSYLSVHAADITNSPEPSPIVSPRDCHMASKAIDTIQLQSPQLASSNEQSSKRPKKRVRPDMVTHDTSRVSEATAVALEQPLVKTHQNIYEAAQQIMAANTGILPHEEQGLDSKSQAVPTNHSNEKSDSVDELGDEDSFASASEDEKDDVEIGNFLIEALADVDSASEESDHGGCELAVTKTSKDSEDNEMLMRTDASVSTTVNDERPKEIVVTRVGRAANQVNSFMTSLPPPRVTVVKQVPIGASNNNARTTRSPENPAAENKIEHKPVFARPKSNSKVKRRVSVPSTGGMRVVKFDSFMKSSLYDDSSENVDKHESSFRHQKKKSSKPADISGANSSGNKNAKPHTCQYTAAACKLLETPI